VVDDGQDVRERPMDRSPSVAKDRTSESDRWTVRSAIVIHKN